MDYPIDYADYTTEEIIELVGFLNMLEQHQTKNDAFAADIISAAYRRYRNIINQPSEEKKIAKAFEKQTGINIHKTMERIEKATS